jgi:hypothetical protein
MARPAPSAREQRELDEKIRPRSMASHVSNARAITFVRTGMAVIAGGAAGILGFTGALLPCLLLPVGRWGCARCDGFACLPEYLPVCLPARTGVRGVLGA